MKIVFSNYFEGGKSYNYSWDGHYKQKMSDGDPGNVFWFTLFDPGAELGFLSSHYFNISQVTTLTTTATSISTLTSSIYLSKTVTVSESDGPSTLVGPPASASSSPRSWITSTSSSSFTPTSPSSSTALVTSTTAGIAGSPTPGVETRTSSLNSKALAIGLSIGMAGLVIICLVISILWRRQWRRNQETDTVEHTNSGPSRFVVDTGDEMRAPSQMLPAELDSHSEQHRRCLGSSPSRHEMSTPSDEPIPSHASTRRSSTSNHQHTTQTTETTTSRVSYSPNYSHPFFIHRGNDGSHLPELPE